ncbi:prepilin-type N-terminal cleavage/methylation domain-containing protein [Ottowia sp.]|jgi:general secretion pathway protein I|uniref:type IV pilus modification PilV family protein n=1 Tax=Ottowia sp. TaxID=1898956 RepID=UPI002BC679EA|nr:prepilin-type N-terminal cleavage/methylation domain-containing protein [Ottowia sp.]HOB65966.1 prepilin-type N-terminal cleavage/methylation domain-containing protein [Ottowia sp.]HQD48858.1 prepilin-type N-terminal cleavage/methylation domain-containing protein [Ottowia sp.]
MISTGSRRRLRPRAGGFSLLEILVAFAIMALSLGALYKVMGNSARQAGHLSSQEGAVLLAESLLSAYSTIPADGVRDAGTSAGFEWQVSSAPYPTPANSDTRAVRVHELRAVVQWADGGRARSFQIASLRPERRPLEGAR